MVQRVVGGMASGARRRRDGEIRARAGRLPELVNARMVAAYHPMADEVDILPLLAELLGSGVRLALPRVARDRREMSMVEVRDLVTDCVPGVYGILEPREGLGEIPLGEIQAILVPGLAFTAQGQRLGRGGGYYDRFLRQCPLAVRAALCYDEQLLPAVPLDEHDEPVDLVVTPSCEYRCCRGAAGVT